MNAVDACMYFAVIMRLLPLDNKQNATKQRYVATPQSNKENQF